MSRIPELWSKEELRNLVTHKKGKKPKKFYDKENGGRIPYLDIKAIESNTFRQYADKESSKTASKNDVLVVWDGARSGLCATGHEGAIGSTILALTPFGLNPRYLNYFILSQFDYINSNPRGTGIPHVDPNLFWYIQVPVAPINEQNRIAAKTEKLLAKVDQCQARLEKIPGILKRLRTAIIAGACAGILTSEWREVNPSVQDAAHVLEDNNKTRTQKYQKACREAEQAGKPKPREYRTNHEPIDDSEYQWLPETWKLERLCNIAQICGGVTKGRKLKNRTTITLPYLRVANVQDGYLDLSEIKHIEALPEDLAKYGLKKGDRKSVV